MMELRLSVRVETSASNAFEFTINPDNTPRWVSGIVIEHTNETPTRLGTIYKNQGLDGSCREFSITAFEPGAMFEMSEKNSDIHVKYTFKPLGDDQCELEYYVRVDSGDLSEPFTEDNIQNILIKLKEVIEAATQDPRNLIYRNRD
ncbi:MAG TPA: hypothetical protein VIH90_00610 [Candidatus Saccharimonadales bacterium]